MEIGFINGPKDKTSIDTNRYPNKNIDEIFQAYADRRPGFQTNFDPAKVYEYKRCLLKHNNEFKYFYVMDIHSVDELKAKIDEYWHLSDIEGYDFD